MHKHPEFLAKKRRRLHDPHVRPLNALVDRWNGEGLRVPYADPDSGGIHAMILFLHESPGPRASAEHGSGLVSPDNDDPSAERFWRLSREAGLPRGRYINWNAVPWYVSGTARNQNATTAEGQAALRHLHDFGALPAGPACGRSDGQLRTALVVPVPDRLPDSQTLPVLAPHSSSRAPISNPRIEQDILAAMVKAQLLIG
jgi:hypothetical protein